MLCVLLSFIFFITKCWGYYNKLSTLLMAFRTVSFESALKLQISLTFELTKLKIYANFEEIWMVFHLTYKNIYCTVYAGNFAGFSSRQIYLTLVALCWLIG